MSLPFSFPSRPSNFTRRVALGTMLVALTACAANIEKSGNTEVRVPKSASTGVAYALSGGPDVTGSPDWAQFQEKWSTALKEASSKAGVNYLGTEAQAKASGQAGTVLVIYVTDFRFVSTVARAGLGAWAGSDYLEAKVKFKDAKADRLFGEYSVHSDIKGGMGLADANKMMNAVATDLVTTVSKGGAAQ